MEGPRGLEDLQDLRSYYRNYFKRFVLPCIKQRWNYVIEGCFYCGHPDENCECEARHF